MKEPLYTTLILCTIRLLQSKIKRRHTGVSPLVGLEVGALGVDLVAAGYVAPVHLAPLQGVAALAVDDA